MPQPFTICPRNSDAFLASLPGRCLALAILLSGPVFAQTGGTHWVTDRLEVDMRRGTSTRFAIVRMVPAGTPVDLLGQEAEGYTRVRLPGGSEGWILSRFLTAQPPPSVVLPDLTRRLEQAQGRVQSLEATLRELRGERDALKADAGEASSSVQKLTADLRQLRALSADAIALDERNQSLEARLAAAEAALSDVRAENERLSGRSTREWFLAGGGTVIAGILLGLLLPRLRWKRRRSSWDSF